MLVDFLLIFYFRIHNIAYLLLLWEYGKMLIANNVLSGIGSGVATIASTLSRAPIFPNPNIGLAYIALTALSATSTALQMGWNKWRGKIAKDQKSGIERGFEYVLKHTQSIFKHALAGAILSYTIMGSISAGQFLITSLTGRVFEMSVNAKFYNEIAGKLFLISAYATAYILHGIEEEKTNDENDRLYLGSPFGFETEYTAKVAIDQLRKREIIRVGNCPEALLIKNRPYRWITNAVKFLGCIPGPHFIVAFIAYLVFAGIESPFSQFPHHDTPYHNIKWKCWVMATLIGGPLACPLMLVVHLTATCARLRIADKYSKKHPNLMQAFKTNHTHTQPFYAWFWPPRIILCSTDKKL